LSGLNGTKEEEKETRMRQTYRLFMFLVGVGLVALGLKILLIGNRLPPGLSDPRAPKVILLLLYLGVGVGFILVGLIGRQRHPDPLDPTFGWALLRKVSLLPLTCYCVLIIYACYAWFQVGHWPHYAYPDPRELPHRVLLYITSLFFLVGTFSILLVPVGLLVGRVIASRRKDASSPLHRESVWYLVGAALWLLDLSAEQTAMPWSSITSWLID
jgi:hypothetical protein